MTDPTEQRMIEAAQAAERRIAECHNEVACPRCRAEVGQRCRNMTRSYRRGQPLKHPHRERWAQVVPPR